MKKFEICLAYTWSTITQNPCEPLQGYLLYAEHTGIKLTLSRVLRGFQGLLGQVEHALAT